MAQILKYSEQIIFKITRNCKSLDRMNSYLELKILFLDRYILSFKIQEQKYVIHLFSKINEWSTISFKIYVYEKKIIF